MWNVVEGEVVLVVDGVVRTLGSGAAAIVPPDVPHAARVVGPCRAIVTDFPLRTELPGAARPEPPRGRRWSPAPGGAGIRDVRGLAPTTPARRCAFNCEVMGAVCMVARAEFRRRRWALLGLAAVTALGLGASLGAFAAAYRTDRAYPDYVRRADVTDLVVNPSLSTVEFDRAVHALPHVRGAWTEDQLTGGVGEHVPRTAGALISDTGGGEVHGTSDGRYTRAIGR